MGVSNSAKKFVRTNQIAQTAVRRGGETTTVDDLANEGARRDEVVTILKRMEGLRLGQFVLGRKGNPSRFEWSNGAIGELRSELGRNRPTRLPRHPQEAQVATSMLEKVVTLRKSLDVRLILPKDLNHEEAARLSVAIYECVKH